MRSAWLCLVALAAVSCGDDAEPVDHSLLSTCFLSPVERVFRDAPEWQQAYAQLGRPPVPEVDFGRYDVAVHAEDGSACTTFSVDEVEREEGRVTIRATRHLSTRPCVLLLTHPQVAVLLPASDDEVAFRIRDVTGGSEGPARACP